VSLTPRRLAVDGPAGPVPTLLFEPPAPAPNRPLVLFGHGADLGKDDPIMQTLCTFLCRGVGAAVAVIDCPEHGERRAPGLSDAEATVRVRRAMADPAVCEQLTQEWRAVVAAARAVAPGPVGYAGFSMGAVFGLSIGGALDVSALLLALGGLLDETLDPSHAAKNEVIRSGAAALGGREVLMLDMTHDEHFPMPGVLEVFSLVPGPKRLYVYEGGHVDIPPEAVAAGVAFLRRTLVEKATGEPA